MPKSRGLAHSGSDLATHHCLALGDPPRLVGGVRRVDGRGRRRDPTITPLMSGPAGAVQGHDAAGEVLPGDVRPAGGLTRPASAAWSGHARIDSAR